MGIKIGRFIHLGSGISSIKTQQFCFLRLFNLARFFSPPIYSSSRIANQSVAQQEAVTEESSLNVNAEEGPEGQHSTPFWHSDVPCALRTHQELPAGAFLPSQE